MLVIDSDPLVAEMVKEHMDNYEIVQVDRLAMLDVAISEHQTGPPLSTLVPWIECSLPSRSWILKQLNVAASFVKPVTSSELIRSVRDIGSVHDVLIIDDDPGFAQLVERILQTSGDDYSIHCIHTGDNAITQMQLKVPDVLLLDLSDIHRQSLALHSGDQ